MKPIGRMRLNLFGFAGSLGPMQVVEARPQDIEEVRRISQAVFSEYGDYAALLPRFFSARGVSTFLAREGSQTLGFIMLGFLPWSGGSSEGPRWIADILAIAVVAERQRRGVGKALMERAERLINEMAEWRELKRVELTCAAENEKARSFFEKLGFTVVDAHHGRYATGQEAMRMAKDLNF